MSLWFGYYNFVRTPKSLNTVPTVKAGIIKRQWSIGILFE
jgi:hypothetical protein